MDIPHHPRECKRLDCVDDGALIEIREGQGTIPIAPDMLCRKNVYVLQVRGDSMIGDHLLDGDHLIVEKGNTARDGDIVVALTNKGEATLRRFFREGSQIRLDPAHASTEATLLDEKDVAIQWVLVGILRKYRG